MKRRIGIFGGTFNPPHIGHVEAAKAFAEEARLDSLIIMPAFIPPHKEYDSLVSCDERLKMCKIAFKDVKNSTVSDLEIARGGKSYTYLTLQELTQDDTDLFFLCGTDMILTMDRWKNPDIIFSLATICYIRRENDPEIEAEIQRKCSQYVSEFNAKIMPIDKDVIEISSSEIRQGKCDLNSYLQPEIIEYISSRDLYK